MNIMFVRPGISIYRKRFSPVRLQEPLELGYLANQLREPLQDKVEIHFVDMELERGSLKKHLLAREPSLVLFWGEDGQEEILGQQASLVKDIIPEAYTVLAGELSEKVQFPHIDFYFKRNPAKGLEETLLGIMTERSIDEIRKNVEFVEKEEGKKQLENPDRGIFKDYQDSYHFLQYKGVVEIPSQHRTGFEEKSLIGKRENPKRTVQEIARDVEHLMGSVAYFKDCDLWKDVKRLGSLIQILKESSIQKSYISVGDWVQILENENILKEFSELGLRVILLEMDFPKDENEWILNAEVLRLVRKYGVEPVLVFNQALGREDQDALVFWLKNQKEGLLILDGDAFEENREIYTEATLNLRVFTRWTKEVGFAEARRRQREYKNTLLI